VEGCVLCKGSPIFIFLLISAINVDELYIFKHSNFFSKYSRQRRYHTDIIGCKILEQRQQEADQGQISTDINNMNENGTRNILIEGCEC
jgi:hypothetical protein